MSIESIGLKGVQLGQELAAQSAQQVVDASAKGGDLVTPITNLTQAEHQVEASTKVIKVGDALRKAVLDILA